MKRAAVTAIWMVISIMICTYAFGESDFEYRNEEAIEAAITDRLSAEIAVKYRFKNDAKLHYYTSSDFELNYELFDWLDAGIGYRQIYKLKEKDGKWRNENRRYGQAEAKWKIGGWKFKDRARLEYRAKQDEEEFYRFRNKLVIKSPWKWGAAEVNPYFGDEAFYAEAEGFNENRALIGVVMELAEHVSLDVYYMLEVEKEDEHWDNGVHIAGTKLKIEY